jgi:hypothetical protein
MQALDKRVKQSELAKNEANQRASNRYESIQDLELRKVWLDANNQIEKEAEALFKDMLNTMSPKGSWDAFAALDGTDVAREREKIVANALAEKNDYITRAKDRLITAFTDKSGKPMLPGMAAQAPKSGVSGALPPPAGASAEGTLIFKKKTSPVASTGTASGPRG